jgi:hypothetical protein
MIPPGYSWLRLIIAFNSLFSSDLTVWLVWLGKKDIFFQKSVTFGFRCPLRVSEGGNRVCLCAGNSGFISARMEMNDQHIQDSEDVSKFPCRAQQLKASGNHKDKS